MFAQARETSASIEDYDGCKADVFIDDVITIGVDSGDYLKQVIAGQHTLFRRLYNLSKLCCLDNNEAE